MHDQLQTAEVPSRELYWKIMDKSAFVQLVQCKLLLRDSYKLFEQFVVDLVGNVLLRLYLLCCRLFEVETYFKKESFGAFNRAILRPYLSLELLASLLVLVAFCNKVRLQLGFEANEFVQPHQLVAVADVKHF